MPVEHPPSSSVNPLHDALLIDVGQAQTAVSGSRVQAFVSDAVLCPHTPVQDRRRRADQLAYIESARAVRQLQGSGLPVGGAIVVRAQTGRLEVTCLAIASIGENPGARSAPPTRCGRLRDASRRGDTIERSPARESSEAVESLQLVSHVLNAHWVGADLARCDVPTLAELFSDLNTERYVQIEPSLAPLKRVGFLVGGDDTVSLRSPHAPAREGDDELSERLERWEGWAPVWHALAECDGTLVLRWAVHSPSGAPSAAPSGAPSAALAAAGEPGVCVSLFLSGQAFEAPLVRTRLRDVLRTTVGGFDAPLRARDAHDEAIVQTPEPGTATVWATGATFAGLFAAPILEDDGRLSVRIRRSRRALPDGRGGDDAPLGRAMSAATERSVRLDASARERHQYVVGQTGAGKSTLLMRQALFDIEAGRSVIVLDPHGTLVRDIAARVSPEHEERVVFWDVAATERPFPFNFMSVSDPDPVSYRCKRDLVIDDLIAYISSSYPGEMRGPIFETHFRTMCALLMGSAQPLSTGLQPSLAGLARVYRDASLRSRLKRALSPDDIVVSEMTQMLEAAGMDYSLPNIAPYVVSKINHFVGDRAVALSTCQHGCLPLGDLMESGKVLLVDLARARVGDLSAGMMASQVVSAVRRATMLRPPGKGRDVFLYADEFQIFATPRIGELLAESRKFGLRMTLANQFLGQVDRPIRDAVLGNVGTLVGFRVGPQDAAALGPLFAPRFGAEDLSSQPNFHAVVRSVGELGLAPFSVETSPCSHAAREATLQRIIERSRERFGTDRQTATQNMVSALSGAE